MPSVTLLPLSLGELLDRTFSNFRKNFLLFVGIMAVPQVVIIGLNMLVQVGSQGIAGTRAVVVQPTSAAQIEAQLTAFGTRLLGSVLIFFVAYFLLYSTALGATTFALSEIHLGRSTTIRTAYKIVWQKIRRLINLAASILIRSVGLMILVAFGLAMLMGIMMVPVSRSMGGAGAALVIFVFVLLLIGAGILALVFLLRYGVAVPALLLENLSARQAIKRSVVLTKGCLWRLFVVALLMSLISFVVQSLFQAPFTVAIVIAAFKKMQPGLWLAIPTVVAGGIGRAITAPLLVIGFALAYYDMRVRKEGFDLELMMSQLDQTNAVPQKDEPQM